jgi:hypothetical protein
VVVVKLRAMGSVSEAERGVPACVKVLGIGPSTFER